LDDDYRNEIKKEIQSKNRSIFPKKDAQKIGEELELIKSKGVLNPRNVVKEAKNKKSILHNYFDWDDSVASEKWRLQQARSIVNHVLEIIVIKGEQVEERAFFNVIAKNNEKVYVSLTEVITTPRYKKQLLKEMEITLQNLLKLIRLFSSMG